MTPFIFKVRPERGKSQATRIVYRQVMQESSITILENDYSYAHIAANPPLNYAIEMLRNLHHVHKFGKIFT